MAGDQFSAIYPSGRCGGAEAVRAATDYEHAGPAVLRMLVGMQLRRLREAQCISREEAGQSIRASGSKISRMEPGR